MKLAVKNHNGFDATKAATGFSAVAAPYYPSDDCGLRPLFSVRSATSDPWQLSGWEPQRTVQAYHFTVEVIVLA